MPRTPTITLDSSGEEEDPLASLLDGCRFYLHCSNPGLTRSGLRRLIEGAGGTVTENAESKKLSHCLTNSQLWSKKNSKEGLDLVLRKIVRRNEASKSARGKGNAGRAWLVPIEWLQESLEAKQRLLEEEWDFERMEEEMAAKRAQELTQEHRQLKGKSRFKRGERVRYEQQLRLQREMAIEAQHAAYMAARAGPSSASSSSFGRTRDDFSGLPRLDLTDEFEDYRLFSSSSPFSAKKAPPTGPARYKLKVVYLADAWQARLLARRLANFVVPSSLTTSYPLGSGRKRPRREEDGGVGPAPKKWKR